MLALFLWRVFLASLAACCWHDHPGCCVVPDVFGVKDRAWAGCICCWRGFAKSAGRLALSWVGVRAACFRHRLHHHEWRAVAAGFARNPGGHGLCHLDRHRRRWRLSGRHYAIRRCEYRATLGFRGADHRGHYWAEIGVRSMSEPSGFTWRLGTCDQLKESVACPSQMALLGNSGHAPTKGEWA